MAPRPTAFGVAMLVLAVLAPSIAGRLVASQEGAGTAGRRSLRIVHRTAAAEGRGIVVAGVWYQSCGDALLLLDLEGEPRGRVELALEDDRAPVVDVMEAGDRLLAVVEDQAVVELEIADPWRPITLQRRDVTELGVAPRRLARVGDDVYVTGAGAVVRLSDGRRWSVDGDPHTVVESLEGLVTCTGRRVTRLDDGMFVGSASALWRLPGGPLDPAAPGGPGLLLHARSGEATSTVGLMTEAIRELDAIGGSTGVAGPVRSARVADGLIWVVAEREVVALRPSGDGLHVAVRIDVAGGRDVVPVGPDRLAIVGLSGRSIHEIRPTPAGLEVTEIRSERRPGPFDRAVGDGRSILAAGGSRAAWLYTPGVGVRETGRRLEATAAPTSAATATAAATIGADGRSVILDTAAGRTVHREPGDLLVTVVTAVDGDLWIGHERGITVLGTRSGAAVQAARVRVGAVIAIVPALGGGGATVVMRDGFASLRWEVR